MLDVGVLITHFAPKPLAGEGRIENDLNENTKIHILKML